MRKLQSITLLDIFHNCKILSMRHWEDDIFGLKVLIINIRKIFYVQNRLNCQIILIILFEFIRIDYRGWGCEENQQVKHENITHERLRTTINPFETMRPSGGSHFAFHILISEYVLLKKNGIYHKMQRERLYNLHRKTYFNCLQTST